MTDSAPDLTRKLIGFRQWTIDHDGSLYSAAGRVKWTPGVNRARCMHDAYQLARGEVPAHHPYEAPHPKCMCGLYAYHEPPAIWLARGDEHGRPGTVYGAIAVWGRVEVHADGFRAEHAQIVCLAFQPSWSWAFVREIENTAMGRSITAVPVDDLEDEALRHGTVIPGQLRPQPTKRPETEYAIARLRGGYFGSASLGMHYGSGGVGYPVGTMASFNSAPRPSSRRLCAVCGGTGRAAGASLRRRSCSTCAGTGVVGG